MSELLDLCRTVFPTVGDNPAPLWTLEETDGDGRGGALRENEAADGGQ